VVYVGDWIIVLYIGVSVVAQQTVCVLFVKMYAYFAVLVVTDSVSQEYLLNNVIVYLYMVLVLNTQQHTNFIGWYLMDCNSSFCF
jgi:hypothetical protein